MLLEIDLFREDSFMYLMKKKLLVFHSVIAPYRIDLFNSLSKRFDTKICLFIGSNVVVGSGAVIVGDVTIGDNVKIGANSVVTQDIPADSVVYGNPMKLKLIK